HLAEAEHGRDDDADRDEGDEHPVPAVFAGRVGGDRDVVVDQAHVAAPPIIMSINTWPSPRSAARPTGTMRPLSMNVTVSATDNAFDTDCSTMITVVPSSVMRRTPASRSRVTSGARPIESSSTSSS